MTKLEFDTRINLIAEKLYSLSINTTEREQLLEELTDLCAQFLDEYANAS